MNTLLTRLSQLLETGNNHFLHTAPEALSQRPAPGKWSQKEILGHLIDSGINNLQRFTEIQFSPQPYPIQKYK